MTNGRTSLDKDGCEYGRHLQDRLKNMEKQTNKNGEKLDDVKNTLEDIKGNYLPTWGRYIIAGEGAAIVALAGLLGALLS